MVSFASASELNFCIMQRPTNPARRSFSLRSSSRSCFLTARSFCLKRTLLLLLLLEQLPFFHQKFGQLLIGIRYFFSLSLFQNRGRNHYPPTLIGCRFPSVNQPIPIIAERKAEAAPAAGDNEAS